MMAPTIFWSGQFGECSLLRLPEIGALPLVAKRGTFTSGREAYYALAIEWRLWRALRSFLRRPL